jgi:surface protein
MALWKNRVPTKSTTRASASINLDFYLNALNSNNSPISSSQNNVSYASVGAGLTDDEVYTYYELVDNLQTGLGRSKSTNPNAFITTWDTRISGTGTVTGTSSIALPLFGTQAITASWGDGTVSLISSSAQVDRTHSYATPGVYTVSITGTGQGFQFNNGGDRNKLLDVGQWGSISASSTGIFSGCSNLLGTAADYPPLQTTALNGFFSGATRFNGNINNWNVVSCSNFTSMFEGATAFNQSLGNWTFTTTGSVNIGMGRMFVAATSFNQDIGSWNTVRVTSMASMFGDNGMKFNNGGSDSIKNWNTSNVTNMSYMFWRCTFNQPIGTWNVGNVTNFDRMFWQSAFNQNIGAWNVEKATTMDEMFGYIGFNNSGSTSINNWRPISCSIFTGMFRNSSFNQPIGNWPISASSINMSSMFLSNTAFNQNIGAWDVSKVTNMSSMFNGAGSYNNSGSSDINNWRPISCSNFSSMFQSATAFNQPIGNWPLSASNISMANMFTFNTAFNQDISTWDTSRVTNMSQMFRDAAAFNNSGSSDINNWNTSNVTSMEQMFYGASSFNQPIGNWDTSNVTTMLWMFRGAGSFNQDVSTWNVGKVTSFLRFIENASYSYLTNIYSDNGWIRNKLQPRVTASFGTANYSASAAEGKALLERPYVTQSVVNIQDSSSFINIVTQNAHNLTPNNKVFIYNVSGSISGSINGLKTVLSTGSATEFTLSGSVFNPADIYDMGTGQVITGYGWSITDGNPV